jgi:hypothetical protein
MAKKDGKLTEAQKAFLVQRFARFDSPKQAADALEQEHGVRITRQSAERYDPASKAGASLAAHLRTIFDDTRKKFLENLDDIAISHLPVRLRRLDRMALAAEEKGNYVLAAALIEQAAKDRGNVFTNRRELTGRDGKPMQFENVGDMTDEQMRAEVKAIRDRLQAQGAKTEAPTTH